MMTLMDGPPPAAAPAAVLPLPPLPTAAATAAAAAPMAAAAALERLLRLLSRASLPAGGCAGVERAATAGGADMLVDAPLAAVAALAPAVLGGVGSLLARPGPLPPFCVPSDDDFCCGGCGRGGAAARGVRV